MIGETQIAAYAVEGGLALVNARFELGSSENRLSYHSTHHTRSVARRARLIANALELTPRETMLAQVAAAFHDSVQEWERAPKGSGMTRKRFTGHNERASADEAMYWMVGAKLSKIEFTDAERLLVRHAVLVTIPTWSVDHKTVVQDNLTPDSHPVIRAVALADTNAGGFEPEEIRWEAEALFAEQELDIMETLTTVETVLDIPEAVQTAYLQRQVDWFVSQANFVRGRKALFETELGNLPEVSKRRMRDLFSRFDDSIAIADANVAHTRTMGFVQFAKRYVPDAFPAD